MRTILRILASLKSAVLIICALTILSMLGTFIPQSMEARQYMQMYPKAGHLILYLGFDDIYHSFIFQFCLWFLSISTLVCIVTRLKATRGRLVNRLKNAKVKELEAYTVVEVVELEDSNRVEEVFSKKRTLPDNRVLAFRRSGSLSLLGGLFIHIGFLAILGGGLLGLAFGVEMAVRGREGDKVPVPSLEVVRAAQKADRLSREARNMRYFSPEAPSLNVERQKIKKLHEQYSQGLASPSFKVVFNRLWVDRHKNEGGKAAGIKSWNSAVSFSKKGEVLASGVARVNQPVTFEKYTFYQANWNKIYNKVVLKVELLKDKEHWREFVTPGATFPVMIELELEKPVQFSWSPLKFVLHDFMPDFRIIDKRFVSVSNQLNNPAARLVAYGEKEETVGRAWAFPAENVFSASHVSNLPFLFTFVGAQPEYESGLQMTYDPGKPIVWAGCILFTLGLIMTFYITYREEWIILYNDGTARLIVTGNRPPEALSEHLTRLKDEILLTRKNSKTDNSENE
ncbi:MAG: cytochrome c biogenesis protein ResB [Candidatus Rifleibacteriota bacterium]